MYNLLIAEPAAGPDLPDVGLLHVAAHEVLLRLVLEAHQVHATLPTNVTRIKYTLQVKNLFKNWHKMNSSEVKNLLILGLAMLKNKLTRVTRRSLYGIVSETSCSSNKAF